MCERRSTEPGVQRRTILRLPVALAGLCGLGRLVHAQGPRTQDPVGEFEALADRWVSLADGLDLEQPLAEERYLRQLASELVPVPIADYPKRSRVVYDAGGLRTGPAWHRGSIFIVEVDLEPGAFLAPHNHPGFCVLTLGVAGSCDARHYEAEGEAPRPVAGTPGFRVRERVRKWITPGRFSDLSRARDNIHSFRAGPAGAKLLDFTTQLGDTTVGFSDFSALEVGDEPVGDGGVFEARWLGDPYE